VSLEQLFVRLKNRLFVLFSSVTETEIQEVVWKLCRRDPVTGRKITEGVRDSERELNTERTHLKVLGVDYGQLRKREIRISLRRCDEDRNSLVTPLSSSQSAVSSVSRNIQSSSKELSSHSVEYVENHLGYGTRNQAVTCVAKDSVPDFTPVMTSSPMAPSVASHMEKGIGNHHCLYYYQILLLK